MTDPQHELDILARVRADRSGKDSVLWFSGNVFAQLPGQRSRRLCGFEGYNISRIVEIDDGYQVLTREAAFYKDPETGEILERWHNPLNNRDVDVVHVWNDPVNQEFTVHTAHGPFSVPLQDLGNGVTCLSMEVFMAYPSPLPRSDYPLNSSSDLYKGAELFNYFVSNDDLANSDLDDVPCSVSWTRIAPWLPWMEMADAPGDLLYQCRGAKLSGGYPSLPEHIRTRIEQDHPEFSAAPEQFSQPNETTWTYFKKMAHPD